MLGLKHFIYNVKPQQIYFFFWNVWGKSSKFIFNLKYREKQARFLLPKIHSKETSVLRFKTNSVILYKGDVGPDSESNE